MKENKVLKLGKKAGVISGKALASVVLGTAGAAAKGVEEVCAAGRIDFAADILHSARSASYNKVRKMWGKEEREYEYATGEAILQKMADTERKQARIRREYDTKVQEHQEKIDKQKTTNPTLARENQEKLNKIKRRTDKEIADDDKDAGKSPSDFSYKVKESLKDSLNSAPSIPGVYVLFLNGKVMKCGRAAYSQGLSWRLRQYYNINYDDKAREGNPWSITNENRDDVLVSWQACPASKCSELEAQLFIKYGKGDWAKRAPSLSGERTWKLLI